MNFYSHESRKSRSVLIQRNVRSKNCGQSTENLFNSIEWGNAECRLSFGKAPDQGHKGIR
jgi:hypothetical protein